MAISVRTLIQERNIPFLISVLVLLVCVSALLLTYDQFAFFRTLDLQFSSSYSSPPSDFMNSPVSMNTDEPAFGDHELSSNVSSSVFELNWRLCRGPLAADYIPCLDNKKAIKHLKSRKRMEKRERHCPKPSLRCLVPLPPGYRVPVPWPKSRDMIWFHNVPHPKLVDYKKEQNWVRKIDDYFVFPGGGTQFKEGVANYTYFIEKTLPSIKWGQHIRVILDVGCGVASFGGYLLEKNVMTMSFAPKDEHEAQIQFALERGIPAVLSVIGTQKLPFSDNVYDLIHCARCRVHWEADGGKPLLELNRILRPGGFFIWSATPVYIHDEMHQNVWKAMEDLTQSICWTAVSKTADSSRIGLVIYQKPASDSCYEERKEMNPPFCDRVVRKNSSWYTPLSSCLPRLPRGANGDSLRWPLPWPKRLNGQPLKGEEMFNEDTRQWSALVSRVYLSELSINWSRVRNVMDMNAGFGGFAAALIDLPVWVMNVVPIDAAEDTLSVVFDRGLIGMYHDWCESFSTYPRTYDLLHASFLFSNLTLRCEIIDVVVEMDRMLRPGGWVLIQDNVEVIEGLRPILESLRWATAFHQERFLVGRKGFWRPNVP